MEPHELAQQKHADNEPQGGRRPKPTQQIYAGAKIVADQEGHGYGSWAGFGNVDESKEQNGNPDPGDGKDKIEALAQVSKPLFYSLGYGCSRFDDFSFIRRPLRLFKI